MIKYTSLFFLLFFSCQDINVKDSPTAKTLHHKEKNTKEPLMVQNDSLASEFKKEGFVGTFVLYDYQEKQYTVYNKAMAKKRFCPASTFKIFNALVALETEVLKDTLDVIKWDGVERSWSKWNRDQNLAIGMEFSALWAFQTIAERVQAKDSLAYQHYLETAGYGNQKRSTDTRLFWLDNSLQISPMEQIQFLVQLYENKLPFSPRTMELVKGILKLKIKNNKQWFAKTGWSIVDEQNVGWYVGYFKENGKTYFFSTLIEYNGAIKDRNAFLSARINITENIIEKLLR